MRIRIRMDFRYMRTLRINFDSPVGIGSCGYTEERFEEKVNGVTGGRTLKEYEAMTWDVNRFLYKLGFDVIVDWRDEHEVEVHGVIEDLTDMESLSNQLTKYFESK